MTTQELLGQIDEFLKRHDMAPTTFGRLSCRDVSAMIRLRKGLGLTMRRAEQMRKFMADYDSGKFRPKRRSGESSLVA